MARRRRQELDLTREELARQVGCSAITLRKLEAEERRPSKQIAERLADALHVAPADRPTFLRFARGDPFAAPVEHPSSLEHPRHNLPAQLSSFVGREREQAELRRLIATNRLVTLTGSGGSGKTRLALQVAQALLGEFAGGAWLADLTALSDPALVLPAVAAVCGVPEAAGRSLQAGLAEFLRDRQLLLLLDNCEHLIEASAQLAEALLRAAPQLRLLATSREPLGLVGESLFQVPSLSLPDTGRPALEAVAQSEAGRLFAERAAALKPGFAVTEANAPAVAQICQRLDGIPLALELAAARVRTMPAEQIAARLDDRFRLLTGGGRTALPRQQTLRALIDWSWDLLTDPERALLRRLSVFMDGWTLEAAEAVGAGQGIEAGDVLDVLSRLVDKSLVQVEEQTGEARYHLLETVRQYAGDRLAVSGETERVRDQHLDFFVRLAETAEPKLRSAEQVPWLNRLEAEHGNFRAALAWSLGRGAVGAEAGLRVAGALSQFWDVRGFHTEGRKWLTRVLQPPETSAPTLYRARALNGAAYLAYTRFDLEAARALYEEALPIWRAAGPRPGLADALRILGNVVVYQGDAAAGQAMLDESLAMSRHLGDDEGSGWTLLDLAQLAFNRGEHDAARAMKQESLALHQKLGNPMGIASLLYQLGAQALAEGDLSLAQPLLDESLVLFRSLGDRSLIAVALGSLAQLAAARGDFATAEGLLREGLGILGSVGHQQATTYGRLNLGLLKINRGDLPAASELIRAGAGLAEKLGDQGLLAYAHYCQAQLLFYQDQPAQAVPILEECIVFGRAAGHPWFLPDALSLLGWIEQKSGDRPRASTLLRESLGLYREMRRKLDSVGCVERLAALEADGARAARLLGAVEAAREALGAPISPVVRAEYDQIVAGVRAQLEAAVFARAWAEGRVLGQADWDNMVADLLTV
jgi:predicted ATPase/DNA-binding XRE family transcriptional regulator